MMEKELSADVEAIQKKYDIDQAAAVLREKDLEEKFSLTVKELSEKASNNNNITLLAALWIMKIYFTLTSFHLHGEDSMSYELMVMQLVMCSSS